MLHKEWHSYWHLYWKIYKRHNLSTNVNITGECKRSPRQVSQGLVAGLWYYQNLHLSFDLFRTWRLNRTTTNSPFKRIFQVNRDVYTHLFADIILRMSTADERRRHFLTPSLIGRAHTKMVFELYKQTKQRFYQRRNNPDSKIHRANMGPIWVLSAPDRPRVVPMNFVIREDPNQWKKTI